MKFLLALAMTLLAVVPSSRLAAQAPLSNCTPASKQPSFQTTEANRLSGDRIVQTIVGQKITMLRVQDDGAFDLRFVVFFRADGSFAQTCEVRSRSGRGMRDWGVCQRLNVQGGGRDIAVWKITDAKGEICFRRTGSATAGLVDQCFTVHEDGRRFAIAVSRNLNNCWPGDIAIGGPDR